MINEGRSDLSRELALHVATQTRRGAWAIAGGIAAVMLLHAGQISRTALIVWLVIALADLTRHRIFTVAEVGRAVDDVDPGYLLRNIVNHLSFGLTWGSQAVIAVLWGKPESAWTAVIVMLAVLAMYVVTAAASRVLFAAGMAGMILPTAIALFTHPHTFRLGVVAIGYGGIATLVHDTLHRSLVDNISNKLMNASLAADLQQQLSERDPLTGLLNRESFSKQLEQLADRSEAEGLELVVAVGNLRGLSTINELHGESVGTALLVTIAARLAPDQSDGSIAARLGGDEFAIASLRVVGSNDADPASRFAAMSDEPLMIGSLRIGADWHLSQISSTGAVSGLDKLADAMAQVRELRNRARSQMLGASVGSVADRREMTDQLLGGLAQAGVSPWFQPIVDANTRLIVGWEALVRWEHPTRGLLAPDRFLPLIATSGLHHELLSVLVRHSAQFLHDLDQLGAPENVMHVNVTPTDLRRRGITSQLLHGFDEMQLEPNRFVVELTEQDIFELDDVVRLNLLELNRAGVHFAVDDFGTGFSSLSHLLDLPTDHLKIDRRFINEMGEDSAGQTLVRGVVGLAQGMGLLTVAEGVETESQAASLAALGCTQLQGFLVAPAMPAGKAIDFANKHAAPKHIIVGR